MEKSSCGKKFLFLRKKIGKKHIYAWLPSYCKSWSCPDCRKVKANVVRDFIKEKFSGKPTWMLTFTFKHTGDALSTWKTLGKMCNRMLSFARKESGSFQYIRVVEPHKDGNWPHVHMLVTKPIASQKFVKQVTQWGFGWNFHSTRMSALSGARYISKYLSKPWPDGDGDLYRIISKTRVVSSSRDLGPIFKTSPSWTLVEYDRPEEQIPMIKQAIINELHERNALFVTLSPVGHGFICESDIDLPDAFLDEMTAPWLWIYCEDSPYGYYPHGMQEELPF